MGNNQATEDEQSTKDQVDGRNGDNQHSWDASSTPVSLKSLYCGLCRAYPASTDLATEMLQSIKQSFVLIERIMHKSAGQYWCPLAQNADKCVQRHIPHIAMFVKSSDASNTMLEGEIGKSNETTIVCRFSSLLSSPSCLARQAWSRS